MYSGLVKHRRGSDYRCKGGIHESTTQKIKIESSFHSFRIQTSSWMKHVAIRRCFPGILLVQCSKHPHDCPVTGYLVASATPDDLVRLGPGPESFSGEDDGRQ